ncbi:MAG: hypothetical protein MJ211_10485 [Bacteroidales bacterium]|nr:hypothetical protein [Bacteroidales bacterium]
MLSRILGILIVIFLNGCNHINDHQNIIYPHESQTITDTDTQNNNLPKTTFDAVQIQPIASIVRNLPRVNFFQRIISKKKYFLAKCSSNNIFISLLKCELFKHTFFRHILETDGYYLYYTCKLRI